MLVQLEKVVTMICCFQFKQDIMYENPGQGSDKNEVIFFYAFLMEGTLL